MSVFYSGSPLPVPHSNLPLPFQKSDCPFSIPGFSISNSFQSARPSVYLAGSPLDFANSYAPFYLSPILYPHSDSLTTLLLASLCFPLSSSYPTVFVQSAVAIARAVAIAIYGNALFGLALLLLGWLYS